MEKETVRTKVMLARGDQTPGFKLAHCPNGLGGNGSPTAPETVKALGLVGMTHTVGKRVEFVAGAISILYIRGGWEGM